MSFTAIEVLVVVVIAALLMALAVPTYSRLTEESRKDNCRNFMWKVDTSIRLFKSQRGDYPLRIPDNPGTTDYEYRVKNCLGVSKVDPADASREGVYAEGLLKSENETLPSWAQDDESDTELKDPWGAPLVYIYRRYAGQKTEEYNEELDSSLGGSGARGPVRFHRGYKAEFQLWSKGMDGKAEVYGEMTHPDDMDNLAVTPYKNKGPNY